MKLIHKLIIWTSSLCLVITSLFFDINIEFYKLNRSNEKIVGEYKIGELLKKPVVNQFKRIELVTINVSNGFTNVEANTLFQVIRDIAISIYLSLGAEYSSNLIIGTSQQFVDWYAQKWQNKEINEPNTDFMSYPGSPLYIINYLNKTNQISTTTPEKYTIPKESLKSIIDDGSWFIEHSLESDSNWIKFKDLVYIDRNGIQKSIAIPTFSGSSHLLSKSFTFTGFNGQALSYTNSSGSNYALVSGNVLPSVQKIDLQNGFYRLKLITSLKSNPLDHTFVKYTQDIPIEVIDKLDTAKYFQLAYSSVSFVLIPFFDNYSMNENFNYMYRFNHLSINSTTTHFYDNVSPDHLVTLDNTRTFNINILNDFVESDGFPVGMPVDDRSANYYDIPAYSPTIPTPSFPTPVSPENEFPYVYVPPTPGTGQIDMDWTDLTNPDISAPTATPENTLSGGIFQMLGDWFASLLTGLVNAVMGFWEAFVNGLFSLLNGFKDALLVPLLAMQQGIDVIKEAQLPGIDPIIGFAQFIIDTLSGIINILMLLVTSVISSVVSFFNLISTLLNILPVQIRPLFQFILGTLSMMIIIKLFGLVFGFIGQIVGVVK